MAVLSVASRRMMSLMALSFVLFFCTSVFSAPVADPAPKPTTCNPIVRKEWRSLSNAEKKDYLRAVNCFLTKPGITPRSAAPGVVSRYDDIVATHMNQTFDMHYVGHFLPWHRYATAYFEKGLRGECGYKGAQPYWDWFLDVGQGDAKFFASPLWDDELGFGGNGDYLPVPAGQEGFAVPGRTGGGCVKDGAFVNMTVNLGPGDDLTGVKRCLGRDFSPYFSGRYLAKNQTKITLLAKDFYDFDKIVEGGPSFEASGVHGGGHYGIGGTLGTMGDLYVSPGDPAFWLHHANLDRVWWSWQKLKWPARKYDFGGPSCLMDYYVPGQTQACPNVTLSQPINLGFNHKGFTVAEIMDIESGWACYTYDKLLDPATL
ncbi:Tyrosinase [Dactylella cylindrospora]|nr:Tyrosinase [Dactylella cylindrospora]